jgi:hypothetical protein
VRILRNLAIGVGALVVLAILAAFAYRAVLQRRIVRELRITSPHGIDEAKYIEINGAQEWITIRGIDRTDP